MAADYFPEVTRMVAALPKPAWELRRIRRQAQLMLFADSNHSYGALFT